MVRPAGNLFEKEPLGNSRILFWFRGRPSVLIAFCCHVLEVFFHDWQSCLNNGPQSRVLQWNLTTLILLYIRKLQVFYKDTISLTMDLFFQFVQIIPTAHCTPFTVKYTFLLKISVFIALPFSTPCISRALYFRSLLEHIKTDKVKCFLYKTLKCRAFFGKCIEFLIQFSL